MDKATKAIRRSGVRLKSISSGHGDLQMIISQLGEVRTSFKVFAHAQAQTSEDILKWACSHENRAIGETFGYLAELALIWTEVQREFADQLKEYKSMYELILEGEKHVTQARETLVAREQRETKLRKEYTKVSKKAPVEEVRLLKERLNQAERARDLAHLELVERVGENEAVKMIRIKEGLLNLGAAYQELAQKSLIIFTAHHNITSELPEVRDKDLHDVKYTGSQVARRYVEETKEKIRSFCPDISKKHPLPDDPPPPYTPSLEHLNDLSNSRQNGHNGNLNNVPSNINNSSRNHPSAPQVSLPSVNGYPHLPDDVEAGISSPGHRGLDSRPTAPSISSSTINSPLPVSPQSRLYPELPQPKEDNHPSIPQPHKGPEPHRDPHTTHFQSVPNLGDGSSMNHSLRYPPLNVGENSSFNDSNFHPDTSSSSPSLLASHISRTSDAPDSPPFNPYYDWLPSHVADKMSNATQRPEDKNVPTQKVEANPSPKAESSNNGGKNELSDSRDKPVRPKNLNPFLEESTDDDGDDTKENKSSGAAKKSS
ncbi:uncharacterized protein, partial [Palaemon carinicauda]